MLSKKFRNALIIATLALKTVRDSSLTIKSK